MPTRLETVARTYCTRLDTWQSPGVLACDVEFTLKKILFVAPPFTLAHRVGPTHPPLAEILRKMAMGLWVM